MREANGEKSENRVCLDRVDPRVREESRDNRDQLDLQDLPDHGVKRDSEEPQESADSQGHLGIRDHKDLLVSSHCLAQTRCRFFCTFYSERNCAWFGCKLSPSIAHVADTTKFFAVVRPQKTRNRL